ncbi:MAG: AIM24 family protein [Dorea sp.]|nr:AIM24 family protein [Dorea sp.]
MIRTNLKTDTSVRKIVDRKGNFSLMEYARDISVCPDEAMQSYFASKMNIHKKQLICTLNGNGVITQSGAMQFIMGDVTASTNIKSAGDLMKKYVGSKITQEKVIKPIYTGTGTLVLEPTYNYVLLEDLEEWGGSIVIQDGMFMACSDTVAMKLTARNTVSSAVLGKEGFFNNCLTGKGIVALESPVPKEELIIVDMEDDVLKVDGNMALAWSKSLKFTVEKTTKTLVGSDFSGEGFVNTYRGTGRVILAPIKFNENIATPEYTHPYTEVE